MYLCVLYIILYKIYAKCNGKMYRYIGYPIYHHMSYTIYIHRYYCCVTRLPRG